MGAIQAVEIPAGAGVRGCFAALEACVSGVGPLLLPHAPGETPVIDHDVAQPNWHGGLAVGTSGSTGSPKRALLSPAALQASAQATHEVLGGPGRWLLTLPAHHIAGLQVILRSLAAGHAPALAPEGSFTPASFVDACEQAGSPRPRYTSLVPTQLARVLDDPAATRALAGFDAVLVGGAATASALLARAQEARVRVVTTYGMSETGGGCIYDGVALPGVRVGFDGDRIRLGGPTLADGYLDPAADQPAFSSQDGHRWFHTGDRGHLHDGRLVVDGRADDVIVTGGLKVWPAEVEAALAQVLPGGVQAVVVGVPDAQWGQAVGVVVAAPTDRHAAVERGFADLTIPPTDRHAPDQHRLTDLTTTPTDRHAPDQHRAADLTTPPTDRHAPDQHRAADLTTPPTDRHAPDQRRLADLTAASVDRHDAVERGFADPTVAPHAAADHGFVSVVAALRERLPGHALPRRLRVVTALPLRGPGKPDRLALRALFDGEAPAATWDDGR